MTDGRGTLQLEHFLHVGRSCSVPGSDVPSARSPQSGMVAAYMSSSKRRAEPEGSGEVGLENEGEGAAEGEAEVRTDDEG